MWRVLAGIAVAAMAAFTACVYQVVDPAGPVEFALSDLAPLPSEYEVVGEQQSCGQGMRPVDCSAVVVVIGPPSASEEQVVAEVGDRLCRRNWRCDTSGSNVLAIRRTLFGRRDEAVIDGGGDVPDWADIPMDAVRRREQPWVVISYDSMRD